MNILITGGCGFIGSNLILKLLKNKKNKILNLDKINYASNIQLNKEFLKNKNYKFKKIDLKDPTNLEECLLNFKPNYIFHLAAESHVDRSIDDPSLFIHSNIIGTFNILEKTRKYLANKKLSRKFIRFHHISTDEVYGDLKKKKEKFKENTPYNPSSPYSASKAASDHLIRAWGRTYNLPYLITNCSNNFGFYQFPEKFIPHIILCFLNNKKIPIYGDGKQIRDWIFVEDHVDILVKLLKKKINNATFNVGGNNEISNIKIVKKVFSILKNSILKNKKIEELISYATDRPGHDVRYAVNSTKIEKFINLKKKKNFSINLKKTIYWYLRNKKWCDNIIKKKYKLERLGKLVE